MALGHLGDNMKKVEQINQLQENNKVHSASISGKQGLHSKEKSYVSVFFRMCDSFEGKGPF